MTYLVFDGEEIVAETATMGEALRSGRKYAQDTYQGKDPTASAVCVRLEIAEETAEPNEWKVVREKAYIVEPAEPKCSSNSEPHEWVEMRRVGKGCGAITEYRCVDCGWTMIYDTFWTDRETGEVFEYGTISRYVSPTI